MIDIGFILIIFGLVLSFFHGKDIFPPKHWPKVFYDLYDEALSSMVFLGALLVIIGILISITAN